jgi:hypothetical protein
LVSKDLVVADQAPVTRRFQGRQKDSMVHNHTFCRPCREEQGEKDASATAENGGKPDDPPPQANNEGWLRGLLKIPYQVAMASCWQVTTTKFELQ